MHFCVFKAFFILNGYCYSGEMNRARDSVSKPHAEKSNPTSRKDVSSKTLRDIFFGSPSTHLTRGFCCNSGKDMNSSIESEPDPSRSFLLLSLTNIEKNPNTRILQFFRFRGSIIEFTLLCTMCPVSKQTHALRKNLRDYLGILPPTPTLLIR